jgi:polysaccharide biosynthesis/export protein
MRGLTVLLLLVCCWLTGMTAQTKSDKVAATYVIGPDDVITVRVRDIEEFNAQNLGAIRVDPQGDIRLPVVGRIHAGGFSIEQLETLVTKALTTIMKEPDVTINVTEFGSCPVSVLGAVRNPGVHQISGRKTLFEVLSLAGGLSPDAGNAIMITRRADVGPLPLDTVRRDASGEFLVGQLNVRTVMEGKDPSANINVLPNDVITVPKADLVYVIGAVRKSGGFVLNEKEQMSVLQALSLAEGLDTMAAAKAARILRQDEPGSARTEIPINLRSMLEGGAPDVALRPNDILFVPDSKAKNATMRALETAIQMGTGVVIWRH